MSRTLQVDASSRRPQMGNSNARKQEVAGDFLPRPNLSQCAVDAVVEVDFEGFLFGLQCLSHAGQVVLKMSCEATGFVKIDVRPKVMTPKCVMKL